MSKIIRNTAIKSALAKGKITGNQAAEALNINKEIGEIALKGVSGLAKLIPQYGNIISEGIDKISDKTTEIRSIEKKKEEELIKDKLKKQKKKEESELEKIDKDYKSNVKYLKRLLKKIGDLSQVAKRKKHIDSQNFYESKIEYLENILNDFVNTYKENGTIEYDLLQNIEKDIELPDNIRESDIMKISAEKDELDNEINKKNKIKKLKLELKRAERDLDLAYNKDPVNPNDIAYHEAHIAKIQDIIDELTLTDGSSVLNIITTPSESEINKYASNRFTAPLNTQPPVVYEKYVVPPNLKERSNKLGKKNRSNVLKGIPVY